MNPSDTPTFDFQQAVATQFGDRPTLREVASEHLLKTLLAKLPWLARVHPALSSADPLLLDSPDPATPYWTTQPLVDRLLHGLLDSTPLDLVDPVAEQGHRPLRLCFPAQAQSRPWAVRRHWPRASQCETRSSGV